VYDAAQATVTTGKPFRDLLVANPEVKARLSAAQIDALLDPTHYTGMCRQFAERGADRAREVADLIERRQRKVTA
jgi:adenylosuccinate lyase